MDTPSLNLREVALSAALDWSRVHPSLRYQQVIEAAEAFFTFLDPPHLVITVGSVLEQATKRPTGQTGVRPVQLTDTQQVDLTVEAQDSKGQRVDDGALSATSDNTSVATVTQAGNVLTVVAGVPGSAVITITDGTLTATEAIDVVAGGAATFQITEGTPTEQPPAA